MSPYAVTKLTTEAYLSAYHHSFDLPVLPFRFFNVYGPGQRADHPYAAVIPKWISAALAGEPVTIHGDGAQTRDFTYVGTVCRVLTDALLRRVVDPRPVNLAFGSRTSLLGLIQEIETATGHVAKRQHVPARTGDVAHSPADSDRLQALFPRVAPMALKGGISATADRIQTSIMGATPIESTLDRMSPEKTHDRGDAPLGLCPEDSAESAAQDGRSWQA